jgi:two-component system sensor histidine kinase ChvG
MKLAPRLTLVGLVTLALPWAGCQYVREVEASLRLGQVESLAASAAAIAATLEPTVAGPQLDPGRFSSDRTRSRDIYAHRLSMAPTVDGFVDDWSLPSQAITGLPGRMPAVRYVAGELSETLFLFLEVADEDVVYGGRSCADQVRLALVDKAGLRRDLVFAPHAPGDLRPVTPDGRVVPRVSANWQATSSGYNLEVAIPGGASRARLGFMVTVAQPGCPSVDVGTLPDLVSAPGWLLRRSPEAEVLLARGAPPGARLRLVDAFGYVLADTGSPGSGRGSERSALLTRLIGLLVGSPDDLPSLPEKTRGRLVTTPLEEAFAGHPVEGLFRKGGTGTVVVSAARSLSLPPPAAAILLAELDTSPILSVTDRAARRLVLSSLAASAVAMILLLGFAAWLSWRIRRLSRATRSALGGDGEIVPTLPDTDSADELGELSRDFSRLLDQVAEYNAYLQSLGHKLTHELRTPMTVVQTSLENLESDPTGEGAARYLRRARQGMERLQTMMTALGAATRVEQAISSAESEVFDLGTLVREMTAAYAAARPSLRIRSETPSTPCEIRGSPDLIAQMLDKLFENAVDFCPSGGSIDIGLERQPGLWLLTVANTGSRLPEALADRLFDSMVSGRPEGGQGAHLGLGLHIARLIARHHGGRIGARNLPEPDGVEFSVEIPSASRRVE